MEKVAWALWGLCTAQAQAVNADSSDIEWPVDAAAMTLAMAESICLREGIDPEDMRCRVSQGKQEPEGWNSMKDYGSSADRMFPVAVHLYLKYGENMLLYQSALNDIRLASSVTHTSAEAIAECQLYCGILGKLLAGRSLRESVRDSVSMLKRYYYNRKEYSRVYKVLESVDSKDDVYPQFDASGTFRTTLDWATFLLFRYSCYRQCVLWAVDSPVLELGLLAAAVGTLGALTEGADGIPEEWMYQVPEKNRIARCCDGLGKYWKKIVEKQGIGYGCKKEDRWKECKEPE